MNSKEQGMTEQFAGALRHYRRLRKLTQEELAVKVGVDRMSISRWEKGLLPRYSSVEKLADALEIQTSDLINGVITTPIDTIIAELEYELSVVEDAMANNIPDALKSYCVGKKEALEHAIRIVKIKGEQTNE